MKAGAGTLDFLSRLRSAPVAGATADAAPIYFMISGEGVQARVSTVDANGHPVTAPAGNYGGTAGAVLRELERDDISSVASRGWGSAGDDTAGACCGSLADNPLLMYRLAQCDNLVDPDMRPLAVSPERGRLTIRLTVEPAPDKKDGARATVSPALSLVAGNERMERFVLLGDSFALAGDRIYPIEPPGEAVADLDVFLHPFGQDSIDGYLSVLMSYLPGVDVEYGDCQIERRSQAVTPRPTLVIEKLDADRNMFLRLSPGVPGKLSHLIGNLGVTRLAQVTPGGKITVNPVARRDMAALIASLEEQIESYAPTRSDARNIYNDGTGLFIVPEKVAAPLLFNGLPSLMQQYDIVGTDKLREYRVTPVFPRLNLRMSSGIDFLEGDARVELGDQTMSLHELLDQYSRQHYIRLADGSRGVVDAEYMKRLERIFGRNTRKDGRVKISFFDLPEVEQLLDGRQADAEAFRRPREFYDGFNRISRQHLTLSGVNADLRPYQVNGVKWLRYLYRNNMGGCLADDMGLGKTLQTIALLSTVYPAATGPTLIVMPRSLLFNWQAELGRFCPRLTQSMYYGPARDLEQALGSQIILTTYAIVRNDIELLSKVKFHMVILDESQNIKNLQTGVTKSALLLDADHRLALSGTPIENNLLELYSLYRFLNLAMFGSAEDFNRRYVQPVQRDGDTGALEALRRRIYPFMLRRVKKDVLKELPDRMDQTLVVEMDADQRRFYEQRRQAFVERVNDAIASDGLARGQFVMLQALSELRRIASVPESLSEGRITSPKLELLSERLVEAAENGHKSVVFFNFIAGIEIVGESLEKQGIDYAVMTGATADRRSVVERFQTDPACKVLLMTLKTGGVGLNLTAADTVFIVEPWWNRAAEEQAINRLHRFGQKAKVMCYSLITKGTIEEKIRELQQRKADLFADVITSDSPAPKKLSEEDIKFILS